MGGRSSKEKEQRRELMKYVGPTGLYSPGVWDVGAHAGTVRRLILARKLAPRYPGQDDKDEQNNEECPICFMFYPGGLNAAACCRKKLCTECYLQIKQPRKPATCPFCNCRQLEIKYSGPPTAAQKLERRADEQRGILAQIKREGAERARASPGTAFACLMRTRQRRQRSSEP